LGHHKPYVYPQNRHVAVFVPSQLRSQSQRPSSDTQAAAAAISELNLDYQGTSPLTPLFLCFQSLSFASGIPTPTPSQANASTACSNSQVAAGSNWALPGINKSV
jgi:hypothetical protein